MSMVDDWPTAEEQTAARERGCTCEQVRPGDHEQQAEYEQDPYCVVHGDLVIMRATLDKVRKAIIDAVFGRAIR